MTNFDLTFYFVQIVSLGPPETYDDSVLLMSPNLSLCLYVCSTLCLCVCSTLCLCVHDSVQWMFPYSSVLHV